MKQYIVHLPSNCIQSV